MIDDPLSALGVDEAAIVRKILGTTLEPYLGLTPDGGVILEPVVRGLSAADQVLVTLLGLRAAHLLGSRPSPGATPTRLAELAGMSTGTVRPKLSELKNQQLVRKVGQEYLVPSAVIRLVAERLDRPALTPRR